MDTDPTPETPLLSNVAFDDLEVGRRYGPYTERVGARLADSLRERIGEPSSGTVAPPAVFPVLFLKALRRAMGGIPSGSILAKQELEFYAPVRVDSDVEVSAWVGEKYVRRDRPYAVIEFDVRRDDGELALTGRKVIVWPEAER
ncbi:MAG: hypothetical protein IRZ07_06295 [Microbispora sp.]|nr:hypothetical protein [Microbispora sp.]